MTVWPWSSALVTGASSGIGEAIARQLGAAGVPTVIVARRADRLEALAAEVRSLEVLVADLLTPEGVAAVAARLSDAERPVDLLVNNAGFGRSGRFADVDADASADQVELNVTALVRLTRAALAGLVARGHGAVLNVSSVAGFQPGPGSAVYSATKAFVTSFTESLHEELRGTGVTATALCPGFTRTEFQQVSGAVDDVAKVPPFAWLAADRVARDGLRAAAAGRVLSIPGKQYQAFVAASSVVPRTVKRRVAGWVGARV
jgi:uncharacterized protein